MPNVDTDESELRERLTAIARATPPLMRVLSVARHLCLPDWLVFSGAVYQPVLNHLTGRPLVREVAGDERYGRLEISALIQRVVVTDDRQKAAEELTSRWTHLKVDEIVQSPYGLIGTGTGS